MLLAPRSSHVAAPPVPPPAPQDATGEGAGEGQGEGGLLDAGAAVALLAHQADGWRAEAAWAERLRELFASVPAGEARTERT